MINLNLVALEGESLPILDFRSLDNLQLWASPSGIPPAGAAMISDDSRQPVNAISPDDTLASSEETMRRVFEASPNGMLLVNSQGIIWRVNSEMEQMFHYARDELVGQRVEILIPEEFRKEHPEHLQEFFANARKHRMGSGRDLYGRRKDGSRFAVEVGLSPIASKGEIVVLAAVTDITARLESEATIKQQAEDLKRSNHELQQFAYVASHDLQEPLRKVASFCALLAEEYAEQLDANAREYIDLAVDGAKRMQSLVQGLLAFSRVESQGQVLAPTEASGALRMALANLEASIEETGAVITYDELPGITADKSQFVRLFQNLIGNAIKYRGERTPEIHIGVKQRQNEYVFSVSDNGIGIEPEYQDQVFGIFKRLHSLGEYPGTGIGLAICRRIVDRLGGTIWVESNAGRGSTFYFSLPIAQTEC